jgi:abortive infection bacteriophage resistance protein
MRLLLGKNAFTKPAFNKKALIALMRKNGLLIADDALAYRTLERIGYYRFSGYCLPFQTTTNRLNKHQFHVGTKLEDVLNLYEFDSALRNLLSAALEKLEIAIRTSICELMCSTYGAHWYTSATSFAVGKHQAIIEEAAKHLDFDLENKRPYKQARDDRKRRQQLLDHYYDKYTSPQMPPAWVLRELATFGFWARTYDALHPQDKKQIAQAWRHPDQQKIDDELLGSWFWSISILRNRCAHHARICHQHFPFIPKLPGKNESKNLFYGKADDLHTLMVIIRILIGNLETKPRWPTEVLGLFNRFQSVDIEKATGFSLEGKASWDETLFWA